MLISSDPGDEVKEEDLIVELENDLSVIESRAVEDGIYHFQMYLTNLGKIISHLVKVNDVVKGGSELYTYEPSSSSRQSQNVINKSNKQNNDNNNNNNKVV